DQATFYLERRDAIAARLDDVVIATLEPDVAVLVLRNHVARAVPRAAQDLSRLLWLVPVLPHHAGMTIATNAEDTVPPHRHRSKVVVQNGEDGARARLAAAAGLQGRADSIEAIDHALGHTDAVEQRHAEQTLNRGEGVGGQRLASADAMPPARQIVVP